MIPGEKVPTRVVGHKVVNGQRLPILERVDEVKWLPADRKAHQRG